jgi:uncharacterized membrane protein YwaF
LLKAADGRVLAQQLPFSNIALLCIYSPAIDIIFKAELLFAALKFVFV